MLRGKYLTTVEAAELIGKGANMIAKLCQAGRLPGAEKMGNSWIIPRESVLNYQPAKRGVKPRAERLRTEREALREELSEALTGAEGEELKG